jgi:hypothetical protein
MNAKYIGAIALTARASAIGVSNCYASDYRADDVCI